MANDDTLQAAFAMLSGEAQGDREAAAHALHRLMRRDAKHPSEYRIVHSTSGGAAANDSVGSSKASRDHLKQAYERNVRNAEAIADLARRRAEALEREKAALPPDRDSAVNGLGHVRS